MAVTLTHKALTAMFFDNFSPENRRSAAHEKITGYLQNTQDKTMEAERINLIGNTLEDLAARTADLRRYL